MIRRILITGWVVLLGIVSLLVLLPKFVVAIPHIELIRPFMILLALVSLVYGVVWLYRQGMKRAKGK